MVFGFGVLRQSSRDFWAMTPRELSFAVQGVYGRRGQAPGAAELAALMRAFPD